MAATPNVNKTKQRTALRDSVRLEEAACHHRREQISERERAG